VLKLKNKEKFMKTLILNLRRYLQESSEIIKKLDSSYPLDGRTTPKV
jgi:hypothetical protein